MPSTRIIDRNRIRAGNHPHKTGTLAKNYLAKAKQDYATNAIQVNGYPISYYRRLNVGHVCTCRTTAIGDQIDDGDDIKKGRNNTTYVVTRNEPLFGLSQDVGLGDSEHNYTEDNVLTDDITNETNNYVDDLYNYGTNCGICYRTGVQPGLVPIGIERILRTSLDVVKTTSIGYEIDQTQQPDIINVYDVGYIEFTFNVPKYYTNIRYAIYNNIDILSDSVYTQADTPLTKTDLALVKGSSITVRVKSESFTHLILEFDLPIEPIKTAIPQLEGNINYEEFINLNVLTFILPYKVQNIRLNDVIYLHPISNIKGQLYKVNRVPALRTAQDVKVSWEVSTRLIQSLEVVENIVRLHSLNV